LLLSVFSVFSVVQSFFLVQMHEAPVSLSE